MKYLAMFYFCILAHVICYAQADSISVTDQKLKNKIRELHERKIDTIASYYLNCTRRTASLVQPGACFIYEIKYLLWCDRGLFFIQRFDECKSYDPKLIGPSFFQFVQNNYEVINNAKLLQPEYREIFKGKLTTFDVSRDHSCHHILEIQIGEKSLTKDIDEFSSDTKYVEGHYNINYLKNEKSLLNKLKTIAEREKDMYDQPLQNKKGA